MSGFLILLSFDFPKYAKVHALKQPKPAAVERLHDQIIGRIEVTNDGVDLLTRQDNGNIATSLCPDHIPDLSEILIENMPEEE